MSFFFLEHQPDTLRIAYLLDFADDAKLRTNSTPEANIYCFQMEEGEGAWLILEKNQPRWGTQIRRTDTPYNDCLPPTEQLLQETYRPNSPIKTWSKTYCEQAENGFYNPANTFLGNSKQKEFLQISQTFKTTISSLPHGFYQFGEHLETRKLSIPSIEETRHFPGFKQFETWVEEADNPDGMRSNHVGVHATWQSNHWKILSILPDDQAL